MTFDAGVLTDRRQHPVQNDAQRVELVIGQRVEEQLSNQRDVVGSRPLDGSSSRGREANDRPRASSSQYCRATNPRLTIRVT